MIGLKNKQLCLTRKRPTMVFNFTERYQFYTRISIEAKHIEEKQNGEYFVLCQKIMYIVLCINSISEKMCQNHQFVLKLCCLLGSNRLEEKKTQ